MKTVYKSIFIFSLLIIVGMSSLYAQCNEKIVSICSIEAGDEFVYLNDFKIKMKEVKKNKLPAVARFSIVLKKDIIYRFNICSATEFPGQAILQLYDVDKLTASSFNVDTQKAYKGFDFQCSKTAVYTIVMYFKDGAEGCGVGVLSMKVNN